MALPMASSMDDSMVDAMDDAMDDVMDDAMDDAMDTRPMETRRGRHPGIVHRRNNGVVKIDSTMDTRH